MVEVENKITSRSSFGTRLAKGDRLAHVVIIGAGVSTSLGIPLAENLLEKILTFSSPKPLDEVMDFLEYAYPKFKTGGAWYPSVEDALGMLDIAEDYCTIRSPGLGYHWGKGFIERARNSFLRSLGSYLWSFQQAEVQSWEPLRRFVRLFPRQVVYVTFNYDLTLETALSLESIPYAYGIPYPIGGVSLIKPHGSINWFYKTQSFSHKVPGKWFDLGSTIVCCSSLQPHTGRADPPPAIIPPAPLKRIEGDEFRKMWTSFSSVTHSANSFAIVGYSLPEADRE